MESFSGIITVKLLAQLSINFIPSLEIKSVDQNVEVA